MPPLGADQGGFHAADAAADDGNGLRPSDRGQVVLSALHGFRVQGAPGKAHGVRQILHIGMALVGAEIEAAVVAADTGTDILLPLL